MIGTLAVNWCKEIFLINLEKNMLEEFSNVLNYFIDNESYTCLKDMPKGSKYDTIYNMEDITDFLKSTRVYLI